VALAACTRTQTGGEVNCQVQQLLCARLEAAEQHIQAVLKLCINNKECGTVQSKLIALFFVSGLG